MSHLRRSIAVLAAAAALWAGAPDGEAQQAQQTRRQPPRAKRLPVPTPDAAQDVADVVALEKFHARLDRLEGDRTGAFARLNVLQIGDSHTAADHFSGRLRQLLQARFGNGGRGLLPPGAPHAYYRPYQVSVGQTGKWQMLTSNKTTPDPVAFGLAGTVARSTTAGDTMTIVDRSGADTLGIGYYWRPDGGKLHLYVNGEHFGPVVESRAAIHERGETLHSLGQVADKIAGTTWQIELKAEGDGPVDITDIALTRVRGIRVSNIGFVGAQVSIMARWDWPRVAEQIASLDPALIILAFGTNEGHAPVANIEARYAAQFETRLRALQTAAPGASLVVVGPPDANRYLRYCLPATAPKPDPVPDTGAPPADTSPPAGEQRDLGNAGATAGAPAGIETAASKASASPATSAAAPKKPPPPEPPADAVCEPLSPDERAGYDRLVEAKDKRLCRWHTPAAIQPVRRIQREIAARHGALYFDWFELFAGECGADRWFRDGLAHKDRVHFKQSGYWLAADRLHARLMAGYRRTR